MKKISDIQENSNLQYILGKLKILKALEAKINPCLPMEMRAYCHVANIENGMLKFAVPNSVWGTRLRYFSPELLDNLQTLPDFTKTKIKAISHYIEPDFDQLFGSCQTI